MELANAYLSGSGVGGGVGGGAEALGGAVRRLAGCRDMRAEPRPCDDKRPPGMSDYTIISAIE